MKRVLTLGFCLLVAIASQSAFSAKVYTWTDKNGITHYGEHPPKDTKAKLVNARTGHSGPTAQTPAATPAKTEQPATTAAAPVAAKDSVVCEAARKNLDTLNGNARIRIQDEKGEFRYVTEEEKQKHKETATAQIKEHC